MESNATSAPTGCFKCGRPGHWSRDCPSSAPVDGNPSSSSAPSQIPNNDNWKSSGASGRSVAPVPKVTKNRVQRPKLTPDLLLSEDGLGYVLRYFPKSFKYRGRGREVSDLGNLIGLYSEWHSHLLPYYSFDQFVHKVQQVASTKRVKICINELRERVASGIDPKKLYEKPNENAVPSDDQGNKDMDPLNHDQENTPSKSVDADTNANTANAFQDSMLDEIFDSAMEGSHNVATPANSTKVQHASTSDIEKQSSHKENIATNSELTEDQKARMEANRLKAIERAQSITEEQRARMEANRAKALERAKARTKPLP